MQQPFDLPADLDTPVSAYLKLAPLQPRFLLESVTGPERSAHFSFLGFGAADELVLDARGLRREGEERPAPAGRAELLELLRAALAAAPVLAGPESGLPFRGGLVGALGYELVRRLEPVGPGRATPHPELRLLAPHAMLVFD